MAREEYDAKKGKFELPELFADYDPEASPNESLIADLPPAPCLGYLCQKITTATSVSKFE